MKNKWIYLLSYGDLYYTNCKKHAFYNKEDCCVYVSNISNDGSTFVDLITIFYKFNSGNLIDIPYNRLDDKNKIKKKLPKEILMLDKHNLTKEVFLDIIFEKILGNI